MSTPLSHVGQTAHPEPCPLQQQLQQQQQGQAQAPGAQQQDPGLQPGGNSAADQPRRPPQQQGDPSGTEVQRLRERQQREVGSQDDPASDAVTDSANHPNDDE